MKEKTNTPIKVKVRSILSTITPVSVLVKKNPEADEEHKGGRNEQ